MSNLFKLAQPKGKWYKFPSFNLGGGAKLYKNFAQKLLAVSLCMAVVLLGTPVTALALSKVPTKITFGPPSFSGTTATIICSLTPDDAGTVDMTVTAANGTQLDPVSPTTPFAFDLSLHGVSEYTVYASFVGDNKNEASDATLIIILPELALIDNQQFPFSGSPQGPGIESYKLYGEDRGTPENLTYQYRVKDSAGGWTNGLPTDAGTYEVFGVVTATTVEGVGDGPATSEPVTFTINQKSITDAEITIDQSTMVYTGKEFKPNVTVTLGSFGELKKDTDYTVDYENNTNAGEATVTITGTGNFTDSASTKFTITQATPGGSINGKPELTATYGQTLGDIKEGLASAIGSVLGVDGDAMKGNWAWEKDDATKVGNVGENKFTAIFTPTDGNYAKTTIDVTVKVSVDTSKWGDAQKRDADGKTQYVDSSGKTSIEISEENLSANDILWLREESYDTSAWYGIDLSSGAFDLDKGLRLYVRWLNPNDADYAEIYAQLDDAQKARVEGDNGWIFLIGVEDPDGKKVPPAHPVNVYVQLGDPNEGVDWDLAHLKAYYITSGGDENVPVEDVPNFGYPDGTDEFGMMTLSHFSPYIIFDELTDEEKAALTPTTNDNNNQTTDKPNSSGTDLPGTGDIYTELLISGLAIVLVSSLGVMLRLITNKKKFEE